MRHSAMLICILIIAALAAPVCAAPAENAKEPIIGGLTLAPEETTKVTPKETTKEPTREPTVGPVITHPVTRETTEPTKGPAIPEVGWLSITSTPSGASVTLDGKSRGPTPLVGVELGAGIPHEVKITAEGYSPYSTTVRLGNGEQGSVDANLIPLPEPTRTPAPEPTKEPVGSGKGWIRVNSNVDGATASFDELSSGCTIAGGSCSVEVAVTGTPFKKFTVQKAGYTTYSGTVTSWPKNGQTVDLYSTLNPVPSYGSIQVNSWPSGAVATLDGTSWQYTPCTFSSVSTGSHSVQVSLSGYQTYTTSAWVTEGQTYPVSISLSPVPPQTGSLSISSEPKGADIYVDGQYRGFTPSAVPGLAPGLHTVRIQKAGYDEYAGTATVWAGQRTPVSVTLSTLPPSVGSIEAASSPAGAALYLDGHFMGTTPTGDFLDLPSISPGYHSVLIRLAGYLDFSQTVMVKGASVVTVNAQLTPVAPGPVPETTGQITVSSSPSGAKVLLDNTFRGITPLTLADIPAGSHTISVMEEGYSDSVQTISVAGGKLTPVTVALLEVTPSPTRKSPLPVAVILGSLAILAAARVRQQKQK